MWSKSVEVLNPSKALMADNENRVKKKHNTTPF